MQQETSNCIGNCRTVKMSIESRPDQSDCDAYPHFEAVAIFKQIKLEGWGLAQSLHLFSSFRIYLIWFIYMQQETSNCIRNFQTVNASIEYCPDQSNCDAYPHLEAVAISKRIELEGWELVRPLHLFEFFQNLPYSVHFYATGDSQLHQKSPNCEGINRISPRPERLRCIPPS
jgi:hypothetical protein